MTESDEEQTKPAGEQGAFRLTLERIVKELTPMVAIGALVSTLAETWSLFSRPNQVPSIGVVLERSGPWLVGLAGAVTGVSLVVALAQSRGKRRSAAIILEREVQRRFDEVLADAVRQRWSHS